MIRTRKSSGINSGLRNYKTMTMEKLCKLKTHQPFCILQLGLIGKLKPPTNTMLRMLPTMIHEFRKKACYDKSYYIIDPSIKKM